jgi:flagellar FliJ protein
MTGLSSMQLAVELATRQRDQLRLDLAQVLQTLEAAQDQFNQLESYAQETQARWITQSQTDSTPQVMQHYYQFMEKLYQAIALQRQVLQDAERQVQAHKKVLLEAEFKLASRQTVCDNMHREANRRRDKIEQKQFDETAALLYRSRRIERDREILQDGRP